MAIDVHAVEELVLGLGPLPLRGDHRDRVAGGGKGGRLRPDAAVEGNWQVLHDDQDPPPRSGAGGTVVRFGCMVPGYRASPLAGLPCAAAQ